MPSITNYTSTEEQQAILSQYRGPDGATNRQAWESDIDRWDDDASIRDRWQALGIDIEDLLTVYYIENNSTLPAFLSNPATIPGPDDIIWSRDVAKSMEQLGDLPQNRGNAAIRQFLTQLRDIKDPIARAEEFIRDAGRSGEEPVDTTLFLGQDLKEIMSLFMSMGNPGMAMLLYTAYGLEAKKNEFGETIFEGMEDTLDEIDSLIDELGDIEPDDPTGNAEQQRIQQAISQLNTRIQTYTQMWTQIEGISEQLLQAASSFERSTRQTGLDIARNI